MRYEIYESWGTYSILPSNEVGYNGLFSLKAILRTPVFATSLDPISLDSV